MWLPPSVPPAFEFEEKQLQHRLHGPQGLKDPIFGFLQKEFVSPALGQGSAFPILQTTLLITCQLQPVLAPHPAQTCQPAAPSARAPPYGALAWLVDFSLLPRRGTQEVRLRRMFEWLPSSPSTSALSRRQPGGPAAHCGAGRGPLTAPPDGGGSLYQLLGGWEYKWRLPFASTSRARE